MVYEPDECEESDEYETEDKGEVYVSFSYIFVQLELILHLLSNCDAS